MMNEQLFNEFMEHFCDNVARKVVSMLKEQKKEQTVQSKDEFLTTFEVAKLLNVNPNTARQKMKLMSYIKQGKSILVRRSEFEQYMREQEHKRRNNSDVEDFCFAKPMPTVRGIRRRK